VLAEVHGAYIIKLFTPFRCSVSAVNNLGASTALVHVGAEREDEGSSSQVACAVLAMQWLMSMTPVILR
jgi:hypothetical protein